MGFIYFESVKHENYQFLLVIFCFNATWDLICVAPSFQLQHWKKKTTKDPVWTIELRETAAQTTTRFLFCDHGNTESTAEIKDAPSGADSCHCSSGSNWRNGTDVSVTSSRSVPRWCLVLAVSRRRRNATVSEIIPSCGRSGAWL